MHNKKIIFVLPRFDHGGVERITLNLCNKFSEDGFDCTIAIREKIGNLLPQLDPRVTVVELAPTEIIQFIPKLSELISKENPNCVITAFPDIGLLAWAAIKKSKHKPRLIHGIHDSHKSYSFNPGFSGWIRKYFFLLASKIIYLLADELVAVSQGVSEELRNIFSIRESKIHRIYNPIIPDDFKIKIKQHPKSSEDNVTIVSLGRLAYQKGFDLLIRAMAKVRSRRKWILFIYGDGPENKNLNDLIDQLGLTNKIKLKGLTDNPFDSISSADLFVMPSRHEGFGNVLVEALACDIPVIAADCRHGPREILVDGEYGRLVETEDIDALADAISDFLENKHEYKKGTSRANQFTHGASYKDWKKLVCSN